MSMSKCENEGNEERELERTSDTVAILCMLEMLKSNIERKFADTSIIRRGVERKEELLLQNRIIKPLIGALLPNPPSELLLVLPSRPLSI